MPNCTVYLHTIINTCSIQRAWTLMCVCACAGVCVGGGRGLECKGPPDLELIQD